jgi:hypothetical protein
MPFDASPVESEVVTVLKKARALIDRPEKWCKGGYGESDQHCAFAAISRAGGRLNRVVAASLQLEQAIGHKHIEAWNDALHRTHAEVMGAFDKAIILAGGTP